MTQYFDNLGLSKKLSILAISLIIPLIILAGFSAYISFQRIIVTKREIIGVNYISKAVPIWLSGNDDDIAALIESRAKIMDALKKQNHQFYVKDTKSPDYIRRVKQISGLVDDLNSISTDSGLSLETSESSYYLQLLLTQYIPQYFASVSETALLPNQVAYVYTANTMNRMIIKIDKAFQIVRDANKNEDEKGIIELLRNQITDNAALMRAEIAGSGHNFKDSTTFKNFNSQTQEQFKTLTQLLQSHLNRTITSELIFIMIEFGSATVMSLLSIFLVRQISRSVVTPMSNVISVMDRLSYGQIPDHMPRYNRKDEVGKLADTTHRFYTLLIERQGAMDSGKLVAEKQSRESEIVKLYRNFNDRFGEILSSFTGASEELSITANTMSQTAFKASSRVASVTNAAEEVTVNIKLVADSSDNLVKSLDNISLQVETSQATTRAAVNEANNSINLINDLSEAAKKIGTIVGLINSIASQTNLLALNATIEAARAGEAGRGFAVVAGEVKSLASQTARATDEIANQINAMQTVTDNVVQTIQGIATTIQKIDTVAADIWDSVRRERISTKEIAFSVGQASVGTKEVSGNITELAQAVEKTSVAATQVLSSANILSGRANGLQNNIEEFLLSIEKLMQESNKAIDALLSSQFTSEQKSVINA